MLTSKRTAWSCLAGLSALLVGPAAMAEPARYKLDPDHLNVAFSVSHIGFSRVIGLFLSGSGSFMFDEETRELSDLRVSIDANSVFTNHKARDKHVRSADFLDAEQHGDIEFVMTGAEPTGERTGIVSGDLTIRGVTNPVDLDVTWNKSGTYPWGDNYVLGASARAVIKRSDYGSVYALEGEIVGDEVAITLEIEAIRQ